MKFLKGLGNTLGIGLLGLGLFLAISAWAQAPDPVVGKVNDHDIRLSYLYQKIESLPLGEQIDVRDQLSRFLESVIQEEILFQSMLRTGFQDEPELREQVKASVVEFLVEKYVAKRLKVTESDVEHYYREHASVIRNETIRVRQIVLPTRDACEALMARIDSEAAFMELAKTHSLHASAKEGGDLGRYMRHPGPLGFEEDWFDMGVDEMRIFESPEGCHLVRVVDRITPPLPPLEEVQDRIRFILQRNQEISLLRALIGERAQGMEIERLKAHLK
ncbi:MAG: hypothetical protein ETSY1_32535 [Candidatus Entotheonella factor]|uniref:PpiC domain-containing protein n=1 Tax=Entotheonella factor TaxID=1429438 RepID=W4LAE4_ENTF1|nr:peptidyl-prolyl cis-trans isomerase [Candidatus Entotheonella palauensis]ETW94977.1 MAG: hypothetical protein ETSY1_32535 [Candidatus Entotheonella factor]